MDRIPIFQMGDFLLVTIQVDMHDRLAMTLQDDLTERIAKTGARGVLIDISALEMVDSFIGRMLANISAMARMLDAETVVVGMRSRRSPSRWWSSACRCQGRADRAQRRSRHGADAGALAMISVRRPSASMRPEEGAGTIPPKLSRSARVPMSAGSAGPWPRHGDHRSVADLRPPGW